MLSPVKFVREAQRRRVFASAAAYVVFAWLLVQVADVVLPTYDLPDWMMRGLIAVLVIAFPVAMVLAWFFDLSALLTPSTLPESPGSEDATANASASVGPELPEGPAIAVQLFRNLSGDSQQDLFAEALTSDIVAGLTQSSHLFVLSANAAQAPELEHTTPAVTGASLGVRYVLSGSVRKSGDTLRVSAQLTDCELKLELWSQRYDRSLTAAELFSIQDSIRERIVSTLSDLHGVIYASEGKQLVGRGTKDLRAYECLAIALAYDRYISPENHLKARECLEWAVELDPNYDEAWSHLSWIYTDEYALGFNPLPDSMSRALKAAEKGIKLAPDNYHNHWLLSRVYYFKGDLAGFQASSQQALALNDSDGTTLGLIGVYTALSGEWRRGIAMLEKAKELNPNYPGYYHAIAALNCFRIGEDTAAVEAVRKANLPEYALGQIILAAAYGRLADSNRADEVINGLRALGIGSVENAREYLARMLPFIPDLADSRAGSLEFSRG